ncbi:MAG: hypothetical protein ACTSQG_08815, partial [Promethearchaeota archaeon]
WMKPILDFSKEVYQREMKEYPGLNDQTIISIPRSGLVQKCLTFTGLQRIFRQSFKNTGIPLHWGHWNYEGHKVVANALIDELGSILYRDKAN